ncbi:MAG: VCBS repeat-containing protein [Candidatus Thermoplasmatota archaeon]|nr:VCBS repeat-containing protein [Candidatus Thermoplasmatota archaeon]
MHHKIRVILMLIIIPAILFSAASVGTTNTPPRQREALPLIQSITFVEKSNGLQTPAKEGGNTELELADMNNDGDLDVICVGDHGSPNIGSPQHGIMVWLGNGGSSWSVNQAGNFGYGGVEAGDLNLDGYLDVVWGIHHNYATPGSGFGDTLLGAALGDGTCTNWIPWATGLATNGEDWGMFECDLADFDCDGRLDLISQSFGCCNGYHLYENQGDGTWIQRWSLPGGNNNNNLEIADFNSDGFPDFAGNREGTHVFFGDGSFNFTMMQTGLPTGSWNGLDCGDMNNDGCDDIVVGSGSTGIRCLTYNAQHNNWELVSSGLPTSGAYSPQFGDINGDGFHDIIGYVGPTGYVYRGDGNGNWIADGTFSMPASGGISAFVVDGDFDHDGREDVLIQAEQGSWPSYQNVLKAFSPWLEPTALTAVVQTPNGGETFRSGSIRHIRWLAAVPPSQGDALVDILLSHHGSSGPWETIVTDFPNNGRYQWLVDSGGSVECRIKVVVSTASSNISMVSASDFTILGFSVNAHGPYYGSVGELIHFTGSATNGTPPYLYHWDFGDGYTSDIQNPTHEYNSTGNYTVVLSVTDADDLTISDRTWAVILEENTPPGTPKINGSIEGKPRVEYPYTVVSTDLDGDDMYYYIEWGDETNSGWVGPYDSGEEITQSHTWSKKGTYLIRCKAKDVHEAESDWATLQVTMPFSISFSLLLKSLNTFPLTAPFMRN